MATYEKKSYIVTVIALGISCFALFISCVLAYIAIKASWEIAEAQGSLGKSEIVVGIQGNPLSHIGSTSIIIGARYLSSDSLLAIGAIPFSIRSTGKKSVDGLTITFSYHKMFQRKILYEAMVLKAFGSYGSVEVKKSLTESDNITYVSYRLPTLNPGESASIADPIFLERTQFKETIPVTFKDGVKAALPLEVSFSVKFSVSVSGSNLPVRYYQVEATMEEADSMQALINIALQKEVAQKQREIRKQISFLRYLSALIFSSPLGETFLVYVPLEEITDDERTVYGPKSPQEVLTTTFPLLNWKLLFYDPNKA